MKKAIGSLFVVAALGLLLVGCFKHQYVAPNSSAQPSPSYSSWHHHFVWGLINASGQVNLEQVCPQGIARIENEMSFVNGLVTVFTGALYQPTTVEVYCNNGGSPVQVGLTPDADMISRLQEVYPDLEERLGLAIEAAEREEAALAAGHAGRQRL